MDENSLGVGATGHPCAVMNLFWRWRSGWECIAQAKMVRRGAPLGSGFLQPLAVGWDVIQLPCPVCEKAYSLEQVL